MKSMLVMLNTSIFGNFNLFHKSRTQFEMPEMQKCRIPHRRSILLPLRMEQKERKAD